MIKKAQKLIAKYDLALLILIILIGTYSRVRPVLDKSFPFTYDIGRDLLALYNIVHHLDIPLIGPTTGLPGLFYGPWWYYSLVPAFVIGNGSPLAINLFMSLTGLVVVGVGYLAAKKTSGVGFGLILASLLAFSPSLIAASTQIWNPNIAPMYLIFIFIVLLALLKDKKIISRNREAVYIIILGILAGLNIDSEVVYGLILSFALIVFLGFSLFKKRLYYYLLFIFGLLTIFAPRIFFELRHDFVMSRTIFRLHHTGGVSLIHNILQEFVRALTALYQLWELSIGVHSFIALLLAVFLVGIVLYFFKTYSRSHQLLLKYSFLTLIAYASILSLFQGDIWGHYIVGVPIFYIFILATALWTMWREKKLLILGIVIFIYILTSQFDPLAFYTYYTKQHPAGNASLYKNQEQVVDYIYSQADGQKFNEIVYTPPVHDYTYQYLFLWIGSNKYHYLPSESKEKLFFVVFEPDPGYEGRLRDWLADRKDDGKIVREKIFPSGITVQTRLH